MILAQTPQTTDIIQSVTSIIQTIAVIISLAYVSIQVRDATKSVKSQTYQSIISSYAEIEARISQDAETARIYDSGLKVPSELENGEKTRFNQIICSQLNFFENLHYQYKTGLLEASLWAGWYKSMINILEEPGAKDFWIEDHELYSKDFRKCVESGKCTKN